MKFESYEEYIVDRLKRLSKEYPDTIYYWAESSDHEGGMDYFCQKENKEKFSNEEIEVINEGYIEDMGMWIPYTLCLDEVSICTITNKDAVFKFKNGIVYSPNEKIN